ncbi:MAG: DUF433 domain-containing protein [Ktedonobacterales bacterium]|jgi:uncharacterized protein (DUF433 family)
MLLDDSPVRFDSDGSAMLTQRGLVMHEVELYPGIVSNPEILAGKPIIKGKRVPVALVLGQLAGGASEETLHRDYGVPEDDIRAAFGHAARH